MKTNVNDESKRVAQAQTQRIGCKGCIPQTDIKSFIVRFDFKTCRVLHVPHFQIC